MDSHTRKKPRTGDSGKLLKKLMTLLMLAASVFLLSPVFLSVYASDSGIPAGYVPPHYHDIKPYLIRNVFETDVVKIRDIEVIPDDPEPAYEEGITFRIFNSTTQETEKIVTAKYDERYNTFYLPDIELKRMHNYILFTEDRNYFRWTNIYAQVLPESSGEAYDGSGLYEFKTLNEYEYDKVEAINVLKKGTPDEGPDLRDRVDLIEVNDDGDESLETPGLPVVYRDKNISGIAFRLVSSEETVSATSDESGRLHAELLEDIQYMVYVDDDKYDIEPFPLSIKDKSEYGAGRYPYDHSNCHRVESLQLIDKGSVNFYDKAHSIVSLDNKVTVSGMKFGDLILITRRMSDIGSENNDGSSYFTVELNAVNPHRWEISKLEEHEFEVVLTLDADKNAIEVYTEIPDGNGGTTVEAIPFDNLTNNRISFKVGSIDRTRFVIRYTEKKANTYAKPAGTYIKKVVRKKRTASVTWKKTSGVSGYQVQYSRNKNFSKGNKTITVNNSNSTKKRINKLKKGKKYYFRIRTYLNTPSGRIYSGWSKKKAIKVK